ncbi:MAG: hypothetical protein ACP5D2_02195 [Candidatus Nanoarchaeia archaeon]
MKDIKALLRKKKRRTGKEAAILIIADNFEYFSKSNRILTDADRRAIVKSLNSIKNIKDFETYTSIANHIQETMSSAKSIIAKIEATINEILTEVAELKWIDIIRRAESLTPQIMTQKQYEDMKKLQREMKLKETVPLTFAIAWLVKDSYPDYSSQKELEESTDKDFSEAYEKGYSKLMELTKSGELEIELPDEKETPPERYYSLLKSMEVSRETLYKAGIDRDYIDTYEPGFNEETGGTRAGVAIIQEPKECQIDERGYFIDKLSYKNMKKNVEKRKSMALETLKSVEEAAKRTLSSFFDYLEVIKAYSELMEYDFSNHAKPILDRITRTIGRFNEILEQNKEAIIPEHTEGEPPHINIDSLRPSPEAIEKMREAIDIYKEPWSELFEILRRDEK